ncbi:extracellular solute-binding protein family 1 [Beutenbergia cavernae DSM 12333]|uniref:Extracellular solute-binding protein family 1 n=1 Tax=Beutenbergia cavernae (strain ATCC BAA-8 / DSM 12333 / CCUG 43141 / JCM 11478 / NBRC 16432 / NCIMB 13614 / HKI 0122) TaxID=471853 RepID=C5BZZ1_BEUC1|nr:maltose ABC transporter substrate-binding protein [Beutenbergia cavernae]ACQ81321.1 extracellular solute-binding protein family 1 [Beutenbergia cavernae DSM 12333]
MRKTAIPVALAAAVALLAACSGGGDPGSEETSAEETTEAAQSGEGVELTIWVDENREPAVAAAAQTFEEQTGATVTLVQKNFEDIRADFLAQVPTGEGPDITVGAHDWLGSFIVNGVVDSVDLADKTSEFQEVALEAFTYDGQLYGLPYAVESVALIRNTALAPEPAPATFDEMVAAGEATGAQYPFLIKTGPEGDPYTYYGFQTSFGAPVFEQSDDGSYTSTIGMGGDAGHAYAEWLAANGPNGTGVFSTDITLDIAEAEFMAGNAPYTVDGPWNITKFEDAGLTLAIDPIPSAGPETAAPFVGVQGFYLSAQSENALLANDFLTNYMATPEAMMAMYEADPRLPAMTSVADEVASDPIMEGFLAASENGVPMPSIPEMGDVWAFWGVTQANIISGAAQPVEAWDTMVADIEGAIG